MTEKIIASNRHARHDYAIIESFEAGIALSGTEVKSLRAGQASLKDSFASSQGNEYFLHNLHISPYEFGNIANPDPVRPRKLLLHRREIRRLIIEVAAKRLTIIPLKLYFKGNIVKVELALAKGKKFFDKREDIKKRDSDRELKRIIKNKG